MEKNNKKEGTTKKASIKLTNTKIYDNDDPPYKPKGNSSLIRKELIQNSSTKNKKSLIGSIINHTNNTSNINTNHMIIFEKIENKIKTIKKEAISTIKSKIEPEIYSELTIIKAKIREFQRKHQKFNNENLINYLFDLSYSQTNKQTNNNSNPNNSITIIDENTTKHISHNKDYISDIDSVKYENTILSDDSYMIECFNKQKEKSNSVFFEISMKDEPNKERANSEKTKKMTCRLRSTKKNFQSKEDLIDYIRKKREMIEDKKTLLEKSNKDYINKIKQKIKQVKLKKNEEQNEKRMKINQKMRDFQERQSLKMEERVMRAKSERIKLDEINFIKDLNKKRMEKRISKKLELTTNRRNQILKERALRCTSKLSQTQAQSQSQSKQVKLNSTDYYKSLEQVFCEDFIWKLLEMEYFDIEDAIELSRMNKFEITKKKLLKKVKQINVMIDNKAYMNKKRKEENTGLSYDITKIKRSKSYSFFTEEEINEVDFQFSFDKKKKKKKKEKLKQSLIMSINSMPADALNNALSNLKSDRKTRKYLLSLSSNKKERPVSSTCIYSIIDEENKENKENHERDNDALLTNTQFQSGNLYNYISENDKDNSINSNNEDKDNNENQNQKKFLNINDLYGKTSHTINSIIKFCRLCNCILSNELEANNHLSSKEHRKLKQDFLIPSQQDDQSLIIVFSSEMTEDLKVERLNSIKLKFKKTKQKIQIKSFKHENFINTKSETIQTNNKPRLLKICSDIEKLYNQNNKDYESIEINLKEIYKILDQKKQGDIHLLRTQKIISYIFESMKKMPFAHKSELKNLGKVLEVGIKIIMIFMTLRENKNYIIMTNRIPVCVDLLLWIFNKPSKIPLGIGFLPDLVYLITLSLKHKMPYEYLSMKEDLVDYIIYSNLLFKIKSKYVSIQGPIDLTMFIGSFPIFIHKSLQMIDSLLTQLNFSHYSKPIYVSLGKISDDIVFILESTEFIGIVQLLYSLLLSEGPYKIKYEKEGGLTNLPQTIMTTSIQSIKVLNSLARVSLFTFQQVFNRSLYLQESICHIFLFIFSYSLDHIDSEETKELLHESILLLGYFTLLDSKLQNLMLKGEVSVIQRLCSLPFNYFINAKLKEIFIPTVICMTYENERAIEIVGKEVNVTILSKYVKEKIGLEPIVEDLNESVDEKIHMKNIDKVSNVSSTNSQHNMIIGVSDYLPFIFRFPRKYWEKAYEFYVKNS